MLQSANDRFIACVNYGIEEAGRCIMATILMIDDDRPILELVKNGLEKMDIQ